MESLPSRAGFLCPSDLELFSRDKFCEITEGQFRIYANQSRDHLDLSYSLLPCKGVEELTDNSRKSNAFQFKIEFLHKERLVGLLTLCYCEYMCQLTSECSSRWC